MNFTTNILLRSFLPSFFFVVLAKQFQLETNQFSPLSHNLCSAEKLLDLFFHFPNILIFNKYIFSCESFFRNWIIFSFSFQSIFSLKLARSTVSANFIRKKEKNEKKWKKWKNAYSTIFGFSKDNTTPQNLFNLLPMM